MDGFSTELGMLNQEITVGFPWPTDTEYFSARATYVESNSPHLLPILGTNYPDLSAGQRSGVANAVLRSFYVAEYMDDHNPYSTPLSIKVGHGNRIPDINVGARTFVTFQRNGQPVDLSSVSPEDYASVSIGDITIHLNTGRLIYDMKDIEAALAEKLKTQSMNSTEREEYISSEYEQVARDSELLMLEEMAHAFYIIGESRSPEDMQALAAQLKVYFRPDATKVLLDQEEMQKYNAQPIEKEAEILKEIYRKRFYPD